MSKGSVVKTILLSLCLWATTACSDRQTAEQTSPEAAANKFPSIILISVDTLRADHLGCYGYGKNTSPGIDRLAADSLLFTRCFSHAPVTAPSCAAILSGLLPHEIAMPRNLPLPAEVPLLPELLRRHGYFTAALVSNYVLRASQGWSRGFVYFDDRMTESERNRNVPERIAEDTTDRAVELLRAHHKQQLFLWLHYQDPHGPYTPPAGFAERFTEPDLRPRTLPINAYLSGTGGIPSYQAVDNSTDFNDYAARYDGEINYLDRQLQRLFSVLKTYGLYDKAILIFTADHGEGMGEHNYFFAHGEYLYNELIRAPLIIRFGNRLHGVRTDAVQHVDIVPTILNLAGIPANRPLRGTDLQNATLPRVIYAEQHSPLARQGSQYSVISGGFKLIHTPSANRSELYNLAADPLEQVNLADLHESRQTVDALHTRLQRLRTENMLGRTIEATKRELHPEEIEKLRALGYVE